MRLRITIIVVIIGFVLLFFIQNSIDREKGRYILLKELLYFPSGKFIEEVSIGYNVLAADLIWLRAIQYFGEHRLTDLKFLHLYHILNVLTTLDKKFIHAYTFGGLLLEHSAKESTNADLLLHKGEFNNPQSWEIPFIRGFIYYIFRGEKKMAVMFFLRASIKPSAPDMCKRFAGFTYQKMGDKYMALKLWQDIYENSNNPIEKETAIRYMKEMIMLIQLDALNSSFKKYTKEMGIQPASIQDMVNNGFLDKKPESSWEGEYFYIDKVKCRIWCSYLDRVKSPILMRMLESSDYSNSL
ncbi:hypothetical protein KAX75_10310 [candidate division WOR-3 bacterium]|nr:hypothetical protein [candidate division WOR-3 bacterium]